MNNLPFPITNIMHLGSFYTTINKLPYDTNAIKKSIVDSQIISASMLYKWYSGDSKVTNAKTLKQIVDLLNKEFPALDKTPITIDNLID